MLAGNFAVVALFVLLWSRMGYWIKRVPRPGRDLLFAMGMSVGTVAAMYMAVEIKPGIYFDLRHALLAIAAFFGGWPAAIVTTAIAILYRLPSSGAGLAAGLAGIVAASLLGLGVRAMFRKRATRTWHVLVMACISAAGAALAQYALLPDGTLTIMNALVSNAIINALITSVAAIAYLRSWQLSSERELMAAALRQAPDYAYVKDAAGRFVAANDAAAQLVGKASAAELIGKTCFEVLPEADARKQHEQEQTVLVSGRPVIDQQYELVIPTGETRNFSSTRVPLYGPDGAVIGVVGVMRDITQQRKLQSEIALNRDTLSYALSEMNGGLAMIDGTGHLIFCNDRYRECFPYTGHLRVPGADMRTVLAAVIASGEQRTAPRQHDPAWIEKVIGGLTGDSDEEVQLVDGTWLQIRSHTTSNGTSMVLVSDVSRFKQAQEELNTATDQLKQLARTDGLTDLLNRRAFDEALENEIRRSSRTGTPLSLLMIDVDHFKAYNDHYGHPAGDACLRQVAELLRDSLKRPADLAARYGGEEFAAILPDTDEDGAYLVADAFRRAVAQAGLPHERSDKGHVTASVGVATYMPDNLDRNGLELAKAADEALYSAKAAGRDRVFGTRVAGKERRYGSY
ncbi:diguanylate cyclase [Devosia aquimaris]|uniref:diguanylate cyclase n=1 Tax=Devosia aquimaris TaxID=2866214 RepID=UPI001CD160AE|nr:diguanylate cyclase [Devosia sp. CJK-A8-3]